jgi:hypothetical protein
MACFSLGVVGPKRQYSVKIFFYFSGFRQIQNMKQGVHIQVPNAGFSL